MKKTGVTTGLLEKPTETRCSRVGEKKEKTNDLVGVYQRYERKLSMP